MNLTTDPWIPIVWEDGQAARVSLLDAFQRGHAIRDLAVRPHERIALMRLLICVAQAALDGPKDRAEWRACGDRLPDAATAYLKQWRHAFELFGDGQRFLQVRGRGEPAPAQLDKLDFVDADMTSLFNQDAESGRAFSDDWIVFRLLTYQCFAAGGCCGGSETVGGKKQPQKGANGPCRDGSAFHCYLRLENLIRTILANLLTMEQVALMKPLTWGQPVWHHGAASRIGDLPPESASSYLGRLVPISRALWLQDDHATVLSANGLRYPSFSADGSRWEPTFAVKVATDRDGRPARVLLSAKSGESIRHPWRELHSVLLLNAPAGMGAPAALANMDTSTAFDLWLGAFVTDQAKVGDSVEFVFATFPPQLASDLVTQHNYGSGVEAAESMEQAVRHAMTIYRIAREQHGDFAELQKASRQMRRDKRQLYSTIHTKALSHYWTGLEADVAVLVQSAVSGDISLWGSLVCRHARAAYELACPHETPRQMKAYALGLKALFQEPKSDGPGRDADREDHDA